MVVANYNLEDMVGMRVLDLYIAVQDKDVDRYTKQFYAFSIVG